FFLRAYARSTRSQFSQKAASWSWTSCAFVVSRKNSYVAGKRNPSSAVFFRRKHGGGAARRTAARYPRDDSNGVTWRSRLAIVFTAPTRAAMLRIVNPSGKTMWNGFGTAITVTVVLPFVVLVTVL